MNRLSARWDVVFVARPRWFGFWETILLVGSGWLLILAAVYTFQAHYALERALARQSADAGARVRSRAPNAGADQIRQLNDEIRAVNGQIQALNTPWDRIFRALQVSGAISVLLTGFETTGRNNVLTVTGEADRFEDVIDYVALLNDRRIFTAVQLVKHELPKDGGASPGGRIRFTLEAAWQR